MARARDLIVNFLQDEASVMATTADDPEVSADKAKRFQQAGNVLWQAADYAESLSVDDAIYQRIESCEDYDLDGYYPNVTGRHFDAQGLKMLKSTYKQSYRQLLLNMAEDIEQNSE